MVFCRRNKLPAGNHGLHGRENPVSGNLLRGRSERRIPVPDIQPGSLERNQRGVLGRDEFVHLGVDAFSVVAEVDGAFLGDAPFAFHRLYEGGYFHAVKPDQLEGRVFAPGTQRIRSLQIQGLGSGLVKYRGSVPGGGVREEVLLSLADFEKSRHRLLGGRFTHCRQPLSVLGDVIGVDVSEGVQGAIGKMEDGKGGAHVLFLPVGLEDEGGVGGFEGDGVKGVPAGLEGLHRREFEHRPVLEVHHEERILGEVVSFLLGDFCFSGLLEFGFHQAYKAGVVFQDNGPVPARDGDFAALFTHGAHGEISVAFLFLDHEGHNIARR